jgi:hypothetical protein
MRTSRISRDTSRILAASRTLRQTRSGANPPVHDPSDSELSSVPSDAGSDGDFATPQPKRRKTTRETPVKVKHETKEVSLTSITPPKKEAKPKKARRVPAKKINGADGRVKIEPPPNWEEIYALTREMRNENHGLRKFGRQATESARPALSNADSAHAEQSDERHGHRGCHARHARTHARRMSPLAIAPRNANRSRALTSSRSSRSNPPRSTA